MRMIFAIVLCAGLAGCILTEERQIAPNIVRLDTHASGLLHTPHAEDVTLQKAAKLTLAHGYDLFKLQNTESGATLPAPMLPLTKDISVSVVMYRRGDAAAKDAIDAQAVIARLGE